VQEKGKKQEREEKERKRRRTGKRMKKREKDRRREGEKYYEGEKCYPNNEKLPHSMFVRTGSCMPDFFDFRLPFFKLLGYSFIDGFTQRFLGYIRNSGKNLHF